MEREEEVEGTAKQIDPKSWLYLKPCSRVNLRHYKENGTPAVQMDRQRRDERRNLPFLSHSGGIIQHKVELRLPRLCGCIQEKGPRNTDR